VSRGTKRPELLASAVELAYAEMQRLGEAAARCLAAGMEGECYIQLARLRGREAPVCPEVSFGIVPVEPRLIAKAETAKSLRANAVERLRAVCAYPAAKYLSAGKLKAMLEWQDQLAADAAELNAIRIPESILDMLEIMEGGM
jgi:hypothetical protein